MTEPGRSEAPLSGAASLKLERGVRMRWLGKGSGQGLAIAKSIVDKHGGRISFDSQLGHGTTFTIRLPMGNDALDANAAA